MGVDLSGPAPPKKQKKNKTLKKLLMGRTPTNIITETLLLPSISPFICLRGEARVVTGSLHLLLGLLRTCASCIILKIFPEDWTLALQSLQTKCSSKHIKIGGAASASPLIQGYLLDGIWKDLEIFCLEMDLMFSSSISESKKTEIWR